MKNKIGIIGSCGMVGSSLKRYFEKADCELYLYDTKGEGSLKEANKADYIYIAVPTPYKSGCDTSIVEGLLSNLDGEKVVVIKSTVIPGTTDRLQEKYPQHKILFSPEFLTEETADQDMNFPDRQIVGYTEKSYNVAGEVMKQLPLAHEEHIVPAFIAEFTKYASNTWFSVKVSKNNELYDVFKKFGGTDEQFDNMIDCVAGDKRIGRSHLKIWHKEYRGYGGKCLVKDMKAFLYFAKQLGIETPVCLSADKYNDELNEKADKN